MVDGQAKAFEKEIKMLPMNSEKKEIKPLFQADNANSKIEERSTKMIFNFKRQRRIKRTKSSGII